MGARIETDDVPPTPTPIHTHSVRDNADLQEELPYLAEVLAIELNFLQKEMADTLLKELRADARAHWKPEEGRVVAGRMIVPPRSSLVVHDNDAGEGAGINQWSPLLTSKTFLKATREVEAHVNGEKSGYSEYLPYKDEEWKGAWRHGWMRIAWHAVLMTLLTRRPIPSSFFFRRRAHAAPKPKHTQARALARLPHITYITTTIPSHPTPTSSTPNQPRVRRPSSESCARKPSALSSSVQPYSTCRGAVGGWLRAYSCRFWCSA